MSGSIFGNVAQVQVPDFQATQMRAQQLAMQRRQLDQQNALTEFFQNNAQGFASSDPAKRMNLLAMLAQQGGQGAAMALPQMDALREEMAWTGQGQQAPVVQPAPMTTPGAPAPTAGDMSLPRGIRNNNPLNLSYVPGQPGVQGTDGRFGRYGSMEDGIAAATRQLQMYGQRGLTTVEQIIGRWAPPSENNTGAYVQRVAQALGVAPNAPVNLQDPEVVSRMVAVMAQHENGRPVPMDAVQRGVQRALGGGGDTIPTSGGATPAASPAASIQRTPGGHVLVPGYDPAQIDRAHAMPGNRRAREFLEQYNRGLQAHLQVLGLTQRGETRLVEVPDPSSPTGRRYASPQEALGQPAPVPDRNMQTIDLGEGAPQGPGRYRVNPDGSLARLGATPAQDVQSVGAIPPGYQLQRGPNGELRMEVIPNGPVDLAERRQRQTEDARRTGAERGGNIVVQDLDRTLELLNTSTLPATGFGASTLARLPGTSAADVARLLDSVRANTGFAQLSQMRSESATGAALGSVTETELRFLQSVLGSLDQTQSPQQFRDNLIRVRNVFLDIVHGPGQGPPRTIPSFQRPGAQPAGSRAPDAAATAAPETPGPGGNGVASPPPRAATRTYNPRTGRIE